MAQKTGFVRVASRGVEAGIITALLAATNWLMATAYEQNNPYRFESNLNESMPSLDVTVEAQM